ncbi:CopD family protein, partial [Legionella pneumophila]|uniref:CopD family protein n=1 Tax=Legionella pneumophila TaxID=446 RepID=UPI000A732C54
MLFIKAFHIIALVAWFAGLFYLPRLYVYHAESLDEISVDRFKIMERRLYYGITWPAA